MADLTFWTNPMSRARIVRWMLEETGAAYDAVVLDYGAGTKAPEYLMVNPMGKVPAIRHRGVVVTETAAICAYLADAFPAAGLAPDTASPARGAYYRWLFFAAGPIEAAVTDASLGVRVTPEQKGRVGYGDMGDVLNALETLLDGREWVLGDSFSAADVYLGAQIVWGLQFGTIESRLPFVSYAERLAARPAYRRAAALDDALRAKAGGGAGAGGAPAT